MSTNPEIRAVMIVWGGNSDLSGRFQVFALLLHEHLQYRKGAKCKQDDNSRSLKTTL